MLTQQQIAFEKADGMKGGELNILVDETVGNQTALGRYYGQAPHIDSVCVIHRCSARPGQFVRACVTGRDDYDLVTEQISA